MKILYDNISAYVLINNKKIRAELKVCDKCGNIKGSYWSKNNKYKNGGIWHYWCISCANKRNGKKSRLKNQYNISVEQYEKMLTNQDNKCAICKQEENNKSLSIDHNHNSNQIRALLCTRCNMLLGSINEDIELLKKIIAYLEYWNCQES